ncbi:DUF4872 domain-containing protein [Thermocatellispora tengchongensis]|uniref:DUF4872 domain-containing protein n=1 Tax=Thermocatellispora tengchongensis TaxID=1073253 RepID=UPI00362E9F77
MGERGRPHRRRPAGRPSARLLPPGALPGQGALRRPHRRHVRLRRARRLPRGHRTAGRGGACRQGRLGHGAGRTRPDDRQNRSFTITLPERSPCWQDQIIPAIKDCADAFLAAPIANLGHRGIEKAAAQVPKWLLRAGDPRQDLPQAALLMEKAGTGGALFRALYRDFLGECVQLIDDSDLRAGHKLYGEAAILWTDVATLIAKAGESGDAGYLERARVLLHDLSRIEKDAMQLLRRL